MFADKYKEAYDKILPDADSMKSIMEHAREEERTIRTVRMLRPALVGVLMFGMVTVFATPVMAKNLPAIYFVLEEYAPSLLDSILPEEKVCTKEGITLQVEAVSIAGNEAEIVVSFTDEEGYDYIKGKVDMYDSYHLECFGGQSDIGSCNFLTYDQEQDKAYFKVGLITTDGSFGGTCEFSVYHLLTQLREEQCDIDISNIGDAPVYKQVRMNGSSGIGSEDAPIHITKGDRNDPRPVAEVMDLGSLSEDLCDKLEVVGVGFDDGVLRVQVCRGNFEDADRHVNIWLRDDQGNVKGPEYRVGWQEEVGEKRVSMEEHIFQIDGSELAQCKLYGDFYETDGCVNGDWKITFRMQSDA